MEEINDIDLKRWKEYTEEKIRTYSLWVIGRRDSTGEHTSEYWGNFIPQIPRQMMLRYTRKGETVLDPFLGSGTTLIECKRLGRNGIGIELNPDIVRIAEEKVKKQKPENGNVNTQVIIGDSRKIDIPEASGIKSVQLAIVHPPYHNIIKFSDFDTDLSNAPTVDDFLRGFGEVMNNITPLLDKKRFLALVIGDKYERGELAPLGFLTMNEVIKHGYKLKSIVVKNITGNERGKGITNNLWRYRALKGGFYVFKHEYIMIFQKR